MKQTELVLQVFGTVDRGRMIARRNNYIIKRYTTIQHYGKQHVKLTVSIEHYKCAFNNKNLPPKLWLHTTSKHRNGKKHTQQCAMCCLPIPQCPIYLATLETPKYLLIKLTPIH